MAKRQSRKVSSDRPESVAARAISMGATAAKIIPAKHVFVAEWVSVKCQFGCGMYGDSLCCPPHSPTPEKTGRMLEGYSTAVLLHGHDGRALKELAVSLEAEAFLAGSGTLFCRPSGT